MHEDQAAHSVEGDRRASSLDGIWRMEWGLVGSDDGGFGGIPFAVLVQRRRACGIDRRGVLLTAVFGRQTEDSVEVAAWSDTAVVDVDHVLRPADGIHVRQEQSYRGRLDVVRQSGLLRLVGTISHGGKAFNVRLELVGALP
ncbi:hypothetical protein FHP25_19950 [Vineibacter terrae]|uniref:Uncharacterized protein n=1 Tax=Vineibacter terrae TaxID=2586908 RepID=A0A5C8PIP6_9HYPH|nr:hypothetical protein [Vineibacter terrae]TXL73685.1 hypothetical protein FHP25_19950 [Vineibacter terrae]